MDQKTPLRTSEVAASLGADRPAHAGRLKRWLPWIAVGIIVLLGLLFWGSEDSGQTIRYDTREATQDDLTVIVTATGNLEPTNQVDVGTEVSGTLASVEVDFNDQVEVGQVLARLDTTKLEAQVLQARAAKSSAEASVRQATASVTEAINELARLRRVRELSGGRTPSQSDLDAAEATLERARADEASAHAAVAEAEATLKVNETDLGKAVVRSPINGVVLQREVDPGQTVAASLEAPVLFTLAEDLTKMELHVFVDEADVGQVKNGQDANFTVDAYPDRRFPARITQVRYGSQEVDGVITYETVLDVDNSDLFLRPGMTATAEIRVNSVENAILVPNAALRFTPPAQSESNARSGGLLSRLLPRPPRRSTNNQRNNAAEGQEQVWTLQNGELVPIAVTTGASDGIHTVITSGDVRPGMSLVVDMLQGTS